MTTVGKFRRWAYYERACPGSRHFLDSFDPQTDMRDVLMALPADKWMWLCWVADRARFVIETDARTSFKDEVIGFVAQELHPRYEAMVIQLRQEDDERNYSGPQYVARQAELLRAMEAETASLWASFKESIWPEFKAILVELKL